MTIKLRIKFHGKEKVVSTELHTIVIGRPDKTAQIDLDLMPDMKVSRQHARLSYSLNAWWIRDIGSTRGTLHNGAPVVGAIQLAPQDTIQVGETTITVEFEPSSEAERTHSESGDLIATQRVDEVEL